MEGDLGDVESLLQGEALHDLNAGSQLRDLLPGIHELDVCIGFRHVYPSVLYHPCHSRSEQRGGGRQDPQAQQVAAHFRLAAAGGSEEAREVAAAYDVATQKERDTVRFMLSDYLQTYVQPKAVAARTCVDIKKEDVDKLILPDGDSDILP